MLPERLARYRSLSWTLRGRLRQKQSLALLRARGADIGDGVFLGRGSAIDDQFAWLVTIGAKTTIARHVEIIAHDASMKRSAGVTRLAPVSIGQGVYIGSVSVILPGAVIGDFAVIGAGSVVTGEIPSYSVARGSPARVVSELEPFVERHRQARDRLGTARELGWRGGDLTSQEAAALRRRVREQGGVYLD